MRRKVVEITGAGPHVLLPGVAGRANIPWRMLLTFSHSGSEAKLIKFMAGTNVIAGWYVLDGGEIEYNHGTAQRLPIGVGESLGIEMVADLSCAGIIDYEVGAI